MEGTVPAPSRASEAGRTTVLADWTRALAATAQIDADPCKTLPVLVGQMSRRLGEAPALLSDAESFTYVQLTSRLNRYARWAQISGLATGDTVVLLMENRSEYLAIWLGLTKVGVTVALLNTNLREQALAHCVTAAAPKATIVSAQFLGAWQSAAAHLPCAPPLWIHGTDEGSGARIDTVVGSLSDDDFLIDRRPTIADRALLIYTSGTTGLPKAANVSHGRVLSWALWFAGMLDVKPADRMYDCLPLYHSVGGVVAVGALLARGGSVVIARSFSVSGFWDDIRRWDCTLAQYIGELCRYLLSAAPDKANIPHRLRAICGNGLRADVWEPFQSRFGIPRIVEFYAASEGNFSLYNMEGEPGAIGRVPGFLAHRFPAAIVRFDKETGAPARDDNGRCLRVARDEIGEAIGRISGKRASPGAFEGYTDVAATEAKILRDVFTEGDAWMRTGDLMRVDRRGFWYFIDRVGDTFRWKGENVSTLEVANVLARYPEVLDAVVFGVELPNADGRAGMAALSVTTAFHLNGLAQHVSGRLPSFARPVFLRLTDRLEVTGTFKHRTSTLADDGFDPRKTTDRLYVLDGANGPYVKLDGERFDAILRGDYRF